MNISIALLQYPVKNADKEINWSIYYKEILDLKGKNIDIILLPEMWYTGFDYENMRKHSIETPEIIKKLQSLLDDNTILLSSLPELEDNNIYNTVFFINSTGVIAKQSKSMLFHTVNEDKYFSTKKHRIIFNLNNILISVFLCYEIRFPELIRLATFKGCEIIFVPAIWPNSKVDHWKTLLKARAIENHCFVIGCNASKVITKNKQLECGNSVVVDPWGKIIVELRGENKKTVNLEINDANKVKKNINSLEQAKKSFIINFNRR